MFMLFINFFQIFNPHHHCRQGEKKNDDIFYLPSTTSTTTDSLHATTDSQVTQGLCLHAGRDRKVIRNGTTQKKKRQRSKQKHYIKSI